MNGKWVALIFFLLSFLFILCHCQSSARYCKEGWFCLSVHFLFSFTFLFNGTRLVTQTERDIARRHCGPWEKKTRIFINRIQPRPITTLMVVKTVITVIIMSYGARRSTSQIYLNWRFDSTTPLVSSSRLEAIIYSWLFFWKADDSQFDAICMCNCGHLSERCVVPEIPSWDTTLTTVTNNRHFVTVCIFIWRWCACNIGWLYLGSFRATRPNK